MNNGIAFAIGFSFGVIVGALACIGVVGVIAYSMWRDRNSDDRD